ncbi:MAG: nitrile hydratase subunit alpha [Thiotrichales bacterium]|nr:nitrile hydratase subunit alpha [Thiotrichales bacterium]
MSGHEHAGAPAHPHHPPPRGPDGYEADPTRHHPPGPDLEDAPLAHHQVMQMAVTSLLIEKGIFSADDMRAQIERMDALTPARGARLVARAWSDDGFRRRLLADSKAAATELGMDIGPVPILVMENTSDTHNLVVCTLCSCYPRFLLGIPPDWYKSRSYRSRAVREPRRVLMEFGTEIDSERRIRVHDSTADMRYMVLPMRPSGTEGMSEEALADLVTRDSLIGVTEPHAG